MSDAAVSVQLYTLRERVAEDLSGTLVALAELGFTHVEPYRFVAIRDELRRSFGETGLSAPTGHQAFLDAGRLDLEKIFGTASYLGIETVIDPFTEPAEWGSREGIERIARRLNEAAPVARLNGVRVGYHNHAHEIEARFDGMTGLELLVDNLDPAVVIELDTYWAAVGGEDPIELIARLGERVVALHIKDGPATAETLDQVAVGRGSLPIASIIAAAPEALRVIELDDSRGDLLEAVADSLDFLRGRGLA